jgi:hypothetical protein
MPVVLEESQRLRIHGVPLRLLFLCIVLHGVVVQTQDMAEVLQAQCGATGVSCEEDMRGSLLQVNSRRTLEPAITAPAGSELDAKRIISGLKSLDAETAVVKSSTAHLERNRPQGSVVTLLAVAEVVQQEFARYPTYYLVVLAMIVGICLIGVITHLVNENFGEDDGKRNGGVTQSNALQGASAMSSASLPPAASARQSPHPSMRNLPLGTSPLPTGRSPIPREASMPLRDGVRHLCPGLVVPLGNECLLAVPALPSTGSPSLDIASLNVRDLDGKSVIQAEIVQPRAAAANPAVAERPLVVLRAGSAPRAPGQQAQPLLAYCKASREAIGRKSVYVYDARDELFAQIVKDPGNSRYVLTSGRVSLQLFFEGNFQGHAVKVTNDQHLVVAETEPAVMGFNPTGYFYKLRVVSNIDVGLMLCALFAIDCMEVP